MKGILNIKYDEVVRRLDASVIKVNRGTKKATIVACQEIIEDSKKEVPKVTGTLAASAFYEVLGEYSYFIGVVGYGGNGNPVNPTTGEAASEYMLAVHEDLSARHPNGKAKFLEDPVRRYTLKFGSRIADFIRNEL
jgi:hypothetical protein